MDGGALGGGERGNVRLPSRRRCSRSLYASAPYFTCRASAARVYVRCCALPVKGYPREALPTFRTLLSASTSEERRRERERKDSGDIKNRPVLLSFPLLPVLSLSSQVQFVRAWICMFVQEAARILAARNLIEATVRRGARNIRTRISIETA